MILPPPPPVHAVQFVDDTALPAGTHWALAQLNGETYCVLKRSKVCPAVLEEAWAGYRELMGD